MHAHGGISSDAVLVVIGGIAVVAYAAGVLGSRKRGRPWPLHRLGLWITGIALATGSVVGPLAAAAHEDFVAHTWTHLLGGMLAPLLLVLAAPVTLALRTLDVTPARRLSRLLRSAPVRFLAHPITAGTLSAGGLWLVYRSPPIFESMVGQPVMHLIVQAHLLFAGYLFTAAIIGLDPRPHAPRRVMAAVVLVAAIASHAILAKVLYAHPPSVLPASEVREGAQLMYYLGGWIEAAVIVVFCLQWYRATVPAADRRRPAKASPRLAAALGSPAE